VRDDHGEDEISGEALAPERRRAAAGLRVGGRGLPHGHRDGGIDDAPDGPKHALAAVLQHGREISAKDGGHGAE
jgi:hypothetical protein